MNEYFHVGERIALKGRLFRVKSVKPKEIRLKLTNQQETQEWIAQAVKTVKSVPETQAEISS